MQTSPRRRPILLLPALLALLAPPPAAAQRRAPPPPPDPAQTARDIYAAGDFIGALVEFERVRAETGDEKLRLDVARTYVQLGRHLEAVEAYETYLAGPGAALPPEQLAPVRAELEAALARVANLRITADREGVEVRLDGRSIGFTPLITPVRTVPGPHVVEFFHPQCEDERVQVFADGGVETPVAVAMRVPPPPPPPPPTAELLAQREREREEARRAEQQDWSRHAWNPMPHAAPWGWADHVPAGAMIQVGAGVGDLTASDILDAEGSGGGTGPVTLRSVDPGLALLAFLGYRLHAAPMFAVGGFFQYQFHETYTNLVRGLSDGNTASLYGGLKLRVFFPLGLFEPWVGVGAGYAWARSEWTTATPEGVFYHRLQGVVVPLEVGLDVAPLEFLTAGFGFQYGFGVWQEFCRHWTADGNPEACCGPGDTDWMTDRPDLWTFDVHLTFYVG